MSVSNENILNIETQLIIPSINGSTVSTSSTGTSIFYDNEKDTISFINKQSTHPISFGYVAGRVESSGNLLSGTVNVSSTLTSTGIYQITIPEQVNSNYPIITGIEILSGKYDYLISYLNPSTTGFTICIREQDNGTSKGNLQNNGFSFIVPLI